MDERIRAAFDRVRAGEELKERTRAAVLGRAGGRQAVPFPRLLAAAACLALALAGGGWLWLAPAAEISIDVNPSVELTVNRLDRVIGVEGRNDDGRLLAGTLDLRFAHYTRAVEAVLESPRLSALTAAGETVAITVVGEDEGRCARMLSQVESCTAHRQNICCCTARAGEVSAAHGEGLSCGKYRAFLELQRLDPGVTVEEVRGMTMGELLARIRELSPEGDPSSSLAEDFPGQGHRHQHRHGQR